MLIINIMLKSRKCKKSDIHHKDDNKNYINEKLKDVSSSSSESDCHRLKKKQNRSKYKEKNNEKISTKKQNMKSYNHGCESYHDENCDESKKAKSCNYARTQFPHPHPHDFDRSEDKNNYKESKIHAHSLQRSRVDPSRIKCNSKTKLKSSPKRGNYLQKNKSLDKKLDYSTYEWGKPQENTTFANSSKAISAEKEQPNYELSGALMEDTNKFNGVIIKYSEPPEARKPKRRWRLYPFKGETALPVLHIHRQSCFLVGRDRKVADLPVDHPSCSKQHAALQYRLVSFQREDGSDGKRVRLYLIDLNSANGTYLNNKLIESRKYYELMEKDVIKFGYSSREYVLLHENSKEDQEDDDIHIKEERINSI